MSSESGFQIHATKYKTLTAKYQIQTAKYQIDTVKYQIHSGRSQEFWVWFPELWVLQPTNLFKRSGVIRLFNKKRGLETKCITIIFTLRPWSLRTSSYTQACKSEVSPHQCRVKKQQSWNPCWTGVTIKHSITTFSSWCFINWMKTTKTRCGRMNGILVGGQRKLVIIWWHWTLFRQRSDTSYDRSWPGVQRRRQVWVQTIIDTLWIALAASKLTFSSERFCAVKDFVLWSSFKLDQNRILKVRQSSVPWGPTGPKMVSWFIL